MLRTFASALIAFVTTMGSALAENQHQHQHDHGAKHGGMVTETGGHHHVELVAADGSLEVYVTHDDGQPEDVANAKAAATVLSEGKKEDVVLTPEAGNLLKGSGSFRATPGTVIVITLTLPDHKPEQARFQLD